jgi:hypothetical protein
MAGQGLRMNGNGRLTAPPQLEAVLATNSVYGMVFEHASNQLATRGTSLDTSSFGPHGCHRQRTGRVRAQRRHSEFGHAFPVTAAHLPSVPKGVAARN